MRLARAPLIWPAHAPGRGRPTQFLLEGRLVLGRPSYDPKEALTKLRRFLWQRRWGQRIERLLVGAAFLAGLLLSFSFLGGGSLVELLWIVAAGVGGFMLAWSIASAWAGQYAFVLAKEVIDREFECVEHAQRALDEMEDSLRD